MQAQYQRPAEMFTPREMQMQSNPFTYLSSNDPTYTQASMIAAWRINSDLKTISFLYLKTLFHPLRQIILRFHVRSLIIILLDGTNVHWSAVCWDSLYS